MFQRKMKKILQGLSMVMVYIDNILISGHTDKEHLENLKVLQRLQQYGLRLKREKYFFLQSSVEYLGYIIDAEGLQKRSMLLSVRLSLRMSKNSDHSLAS